MKQHIDTHLQEIPFKIIAVVIVGVLAFYAGYTQPLSDEHEQVLGMFEISQAN